jgi:hypothetical protein
MMFNREKFNKEIASLKELDENSNELSLQDMERLKQGVLKAIAGISPEEAAQSRWPKFGSLINFAVATLLGLLLLGGTAFAAGNSIPGDVLYPVKLAAEKVELSLALSQKSKINLQTNFARERLNELQKLVEKKSAPAAVVMPPNAADIPSSSPAVFTSPKATSSSPLLPGPDEYSNRQINNLVAKAKTTAAAQVNLALGILRQEQTILQNKGANDEAEALDKNISDLQTQARAQNINIGEVDNNNGGDAQINKDNQTSSAEVKPLNQNNGVPSPSGANSQPKTDGQNHSFGASSGFSSGDTSSAVGPNPSEPKQSPTAAGQTLIQTPTPSKAPDQTQGNPEQKTSNSPAPGQQDGLSHKNNQE